MAITGDPISVWDSDNAAVGYGTMDGTYTAGSPGSVQTITLPDTGSLSIGAGYMNPNIAVSNVAGYPTGMGVHYPNASNIYPNSNVVIDNASLLITYGGKQINVGQAIHMLMERLCMIEPSFHLHEKYPALKEAYDAYRAIEAMCKAGDKQEEDQI